MSGEMLGQLRSGAGCCSDLSEQFLDQLAGDGGIDGVQQAEDRRVLLLALDGEASDGTPLVTAPASRAGNVGALDRQTTSRAAPGAGAQDSSAPRIVARLGRFLLPVFDAVAAPVVPVLRPRRELVAT